MQPGRELDLLVAEKVMGLTIDSAMCYPANKEECDIFRNGAFYKVCPYYSIDITTAWEVVEKIKESNDPFYLSFYDHKYLCQFAKDKDHAIADTAPHAICLAALKAKGVDINSYDAQWRHEYRMKKINNIFKARNEL
jgi:Phage ABA sandwich domain